LAGRISRILSVLVPGAIWRSANPRYPASSSHCPCQSSLRPARHSGCRPNSGKATAATCHNHNNQGQPMTSTGPCWPLRDHNKAKRKLRRQGWHQLRVAYCQALRKRAPGGKMERAFCRLERMAGRLGTQGGQANHPAWLSWGCPSKARVSKLRNAKACHVCVNDHFVMFSLWANSQTSVQCVVVNIVYQILRFDPLPLWARTTPVRQPFTKLL